MGRSKKSKFRWIKVLLVATLVYGTVFLIWSRVRTFRLSLDQARVWSFFPTPGGLSVMHPGRWEEWKRNERIAGTIFWPCVLVDERLTKRRYWPAQFSDPPRDISF